jgi:hypothetical protein
MQKSVLAAPIAMMAVACGAYAMPGEGSSPTPGGGMNYDVTATETVHQVSMHVGQRLEVVLHAPSGMANWSHPESSDKAVLVPIVDPAATAARGVTLAAFEARKAGQVEVRANASPLCSPGQPCPMLIAVYSLRVIVTP